ARGTQAGRADQRAVRFGDAVDALDRLHVRQRAQQRVDRARSGPDRVGRRGERQVHSRAPTPASAVRIASICWATPARTSPASDSTTQLIGPILTTSSRLISTTAALSGRTPP